MPLADFVRKGTLHHRDVTDAEVLALVKEANQHLSIGSTLKPDDADRDTYSYTGIVKLAGALVAAAGYHTSHKTDDADLFTAAKRLLPDCKEFLDQAVEWQKRRALIAKKKSWPIEPALADAQLEGAWMLRAAVLEWIRGHRPKAVAALESVRR
jgi:hypothetical protein